MNKEENMKKKVGLFMGSFDPIHAGHIAVITKVLNLGLVDEVFIVTTPGNPWKEEPGASFELRNLIICQTLGNEYQRLRSKVFIIHGGDDNWNVEPFRDKEDGQFYSYIQLGLIKEKYPENDYYIIGGTDVKESISKWKNSAWILENFKFLPILRAGMGEGDTDENYPLPPIHLSSTDIRNAIKAGYNPVPYIAESTWDIIKDYKLYGLQ